MSGFEKDKYKFSLHTPLSIIREGDSEKRREEIMLLSDELDNYQILFKDLLSDEPSYSTRNKILNIAYFIIEEVEIYDQLKEKYDLPIGKLIKRTPINRGFLETWRDYIITYVTILANPNYSYIQECLKIEENVNILGASEIQEEKNLKKIKEYKGIVISKKLRSYIIITHKGEFKKVKVREAYEVGMEVTGEVKKSIKNYKVQIAILITLIVLMTGIIVFKYKSVDKTVIIETTSSLKLEVNYFNKIIKVYSPTAKGEDMLTSIGVVDKDIDEGIYRILNYASRNEMIPEDGVTIVITGKPIEYGALHKSEKFINESGVYVRYNNSGNQHNFNPKQ
ncbi:anti-sigma factor domain-containing protein [Clostridium chauvoei]|uniref:anti-sigma factor domain-containing protein n=1 Tax=Clostridium chauvoei TaxID=46867 RepID=UPI000BB8CFB1|nr:anti-sigma factor domain-containing protein [Clostridium chauvoei]ATD56303.1 hypothetical protein BTM21_00255 [Clostridium chauvoei]MBX7379099.1 anti-sigma factor domain-containing protein [Clostridium chauvoei]MBX7384241.1 anti-sigma factor domain-containing protein [Clostridium chauvoei]MBX7396957.1 anti-sigma factor domain-containing protein [Clostridium chauvoei]MBX7399308.1 anti-sigma factor domain-containing protein [Clostridium chauvoei]